MLENIAGTGIIEQLFFPSKIDMSEMLSLLQYKQVRLLVYGEQVVDKPHLVRIVRLYDKTKRVWVTSKTRKKKKKVLQEREHNLLYMSLVVLLAYLL